jgi:hypothetical protein
MEAYLGTGAGRAAARGGADGGGDGPLVRSGVMELRPWLQWSAGTTSSVAWRGGCGRDGRHAWNLREVP